MVAYFFSSLLNQANEPEGLNPGHGPSERPAINIADDDVDRATSAP